MRKKLIYLLKNNGLNILLVTFLSRKIKTKQNLTTLLSKIFTDNYETTFLMNVSNNKRRNKNRSIPYRPNTKRIKQLYHLYMSTNKSKKQLHHLLYVSELGTCDNCCDNCCDNFPANKLLSPVTLLLNIVSKLHFDCEE